MPPASVLGSMYSERNTCIIQLILFNSLVAVIFQVIRILFECVLNYTKEELKMRNGATEEMM